MPIEDYIKVVGDESQIREFHNIMPELKEGEGWFISMSCRSKKMTDEERKQYKMTHKEMWGRRVLFKNSFEDFLSVLYSYHQNKKAYPGVFLEQKALVCYMNINPVSTGKALAAFKNRLNEWEYKKIYENASEGFSPFKILENSFHASKGTKHFIDIDIDWDNGINNESETLKAIEFLSNMQSGKSFSLNKDYYMIKTGSGGIHCLVKVSSLREQSINIQKEICEPLNEMFKDKTKEIKINTDGMIPVPGSLQYGEIVRLCSGR